MKVDILISDEVDSGLDTELFDSAAGVVFSELDVTFDECEISLLICTDDEIKGLNGEYRQKDSATDVLSFPMSEAPYDEGGMLGDIAISIDTAKRQAEEREIDIKREVAFLFIHGLLHLMGFDHEISEDDEKEMFDLQEKILLKLVESGKVP